MTDIVLTPTYSAFVTPVQPPLRSVQSVFNRAEFFAKYDVEVTFLERVMGGIPVDPKIMEGWIAKKLSGDGDIDMKLALMRELETLGVEVGEEMTMDQIYEIARKHTDEKKGNTFRRDEHGLYLGAYQFKAAIKEATNILWGDLRFGPTRKGAKPYVAERVFVPDQRIYLGRQEPDGTHLQIGQVSGPQGKRSTLTHYDYVENATVRFSVLALKSSLKELTDARWAELWTLMELNGVGAIRSLGQGTFAVTGYRRVDEPT